MIFFNLIDSFQKKVAHAESLMRMHFGVDEPRLFRQNNVNRSGEFKTFKYSFHGVGCRFSFKKYNVDYDYGDKGRIDGFDLWRLSEYGKQFAEFREYVNSGGLEAEFKLSVATGKLKHSEGQHDNLYYLA